MPLVENGKGVGRKKFVPSDVERALVRTSCAGGIKHDQIYGGLGIGKTTFYREFKAEVEYGNMHMNVAVINKVYQAAMGGSVKAMIYWLSTRMPEEWSPSYQLRHGLIGKKDEEYILEMHMGLPSDKVFDDPQKE